MEGDNMREEYNIAKLNPRKNPYVSKLKQQISINLDCEIVDYFKKQANNLGIPYQVLINSYLADCVKNERHLKWE